MNIGRMLSVLAALSAVGITFVLSSGLARKSSTSSSSITKSNINNSISAPQSNTINILLDSARDYYLKGDYKKADIFFERVLEIDPNHIVTLNSRGTLLQYRLADYDRARDCFEKVLQVDPKNIVALNSIEILGKKKEDEANQQKEKPAAATVKAASKKEEKPASPSSDSGTVPRADPRNPYNDPTLPYYNRDLDKKNK
jgi:tetratricopeptide (TPR) repeat protein